MYDDSAGTIDLGAARAARREGKAKEIRIPLGDGHDPVVLPVELPVDTLTPLKRLDLDKDLGLIFQARDQETGERVLRDLLTIRPQLATELLAAGKGCLERLFCSGIQPPPEGEPAKPWCDVEHDPTTHAADCEWLRFLAWRPSVPDYVALLRGLITAYGANLGEAFAPSGSSGTGGATSKRTSRGTTRSRTRAASGSAPATTGS